MKCRNKFDAKHLLPYIPLMSHFKKWINAFVGTYVKECIDPRAHEEDPES